VKEDRQTEQREEKKEKHKGGNQKNTMIPWWSYSVRKWAAICDWGKEEVAPGGRGKRKVRKHVKGLRVEARRARSPGMGWRSREGWMPVMALRQKQNRQPWLV